MEEAKVAGTERPEKWWSWHRFPLVPEVRYRPANQYNTQSLYVGWLAFKLWTHDSVKLGVEFDIEDSIILRFHLPYVYVGLWFPLFPMFWLQRLWRKPPGRK